jgi:hypothetical protein
MKLTIIIPKEFLCCQLVTEHARTLQMYYTNLLYEQLFYDSGGISFP